MHVEKGCYNEIVKDKTSRAHGWFWKKCKETNNLITKPKMEHKILTHDAPPPVLVHKSPRLEETSPNLAHKTKYSQINNWWVNLFFRKWYIINEWYLRFLVSFHLETILLESDKKCLKISPTNILFLKCREVVRGFRTTSQMRYLNRQKLSKRLVCTFFLLQSCKLYLNQMEKLKMKIRRCFPPLY